MSLLDDLTFRNMALMSVTLNTSHFDVSLLNGLTFENVSCLLAARHNP